MMQLTIADKYSDRCDAKCDADEWCTIDCESDEDVLQRSTWNFKDQNGKSRDKSAKLLARIEFIHLQAALFTGTVKQKSH